MSTPTPQNASGSASSATPQDQNSTVRDFFKRRGFTRALAAFEQDLVTAGQSNINGGQGNNQTGSSYQRPINVDEFAARNAAPAANTRSQTAAAQSLANPNASANNSNNSTTQANAKKEEEVKQKTSLDLQAWDAGFKSLTAFCLGSLALHRAELCQILWPIFVHIYLEVMMQSDPTSATTAAGLSEAQRLIGVADSVMHQYAQHFQDFHYTEICQLRAIRSADHVRASPLARRWRSDRYILPMSERGWGLLQSWLAGGGLMDTASTAGSKPGVPQLGDKGRDKVLAIINERIQLRITKTVGNVADAPSGLVYDLLPEKPANAGDRQSTGPSGSDLPSEAISTTLPTRDPKLDKEVNRTLKDSGEQPISIVVTDGDADDEVPTGLPYPPGFKVADVKREVEKVREGRKRIRLGPEAFANDASQDKERPQQARPGGVFQPSVCMFTIQDSNDGLTGSALSLDATHLACGFQESHIRLWNLKGEKFRPYRSDFDARDIKDANSLKKFRVKDGTSSVKLIGHSGPVYSLSFDPTNGTAAPPKHLLSASQDSTVRLWSLETCSNLVAYRGHRDVIWDVEWGPKGVYFATASRDRTARIWTTDRTSPLRMMAGHLSDVDCVRFHPNSMYLATGSSDRTCRLWDVQRGSCVRVFVGHQGGISCMAFSPDGRYLASAADDELVNLWDLASGKLIKSMKGHTSRINSLAFSMESTVLLSGSSDNTISIWDVDAQRKDNVLSGIDLKSLGLNAEGFSGLKSTSAISLSDSLRGDGNSSATLGVLPKSAFADEESGRSPDLLGVLLTKRTPVHNVMFTERNLALAVGMA